MLLYIQQHQIHIQIFQVIVVDLKAKNQFNICKFLGKKSRPRAYKTFFMLNSAEHEI